MGNCCKKKQSYHHRYHHDKMMMIKKKSVADITPFDQFFDDWKQSPTSKITLCGDPGTPVTHYLRFSLLYKPFSLRFFPSKLTPSLFTLHFEDEDPILGSAETVLEYVGSKLPSLALMLRGREETTPFVVRLAAIQHRSMRWHVERVVRWGMDLATRVGKTAVDPSVGTPRMEMVKFGKSYGKLLELLLEHAQTEERVVFPILQAVDRGVCRCVNEEHARDLPIMNGIKEDIKSIGVLEAGSPTHREALRSLSARLNTLQS